MNYLVISDNKIILSTKIILINGSTTFNSFSIPNGSIIKLIEVRSRPKYPKKNIYYFKVLKSSYKYLINSKGSLWSPLNKDGTPQYKNNMIKLNESELKHYLL
tara:strand:- start:672 stop:980 length:309 start_codon:yes stop_codon:yes gene_type:complete